MHIVSCYKLVPEEQDVTVRGDRTLDFSKAEWKIGQYDLNAVELGVQLAEAGAHACSVLSAGGQILSDSKLRKGILSRGAQDLYCVVDESLAAADSYRTAQVLAAAVRKLGDVSLVLCGEGSADIYSQQVGSILGGLLGWVSLNAVTAVRVEGDALLLERGLESETEVLRVQMPAVLSVNAEINTPRIPKMKEILGAGKKPVTAWSLGDVEVGAGGDGLTTCSEAALQQADRMKIIVEGDAPEKIDELYQHLRKLLQ